MVEWVSGVLPLVKRVSEVTQIDIDASDAVIFSPGPGLPSETYDLLNLVSYACEHKVVLGVCLGQQAIAESYGAKLKQLVNVYHGVSRIGRIVEHDPMFEEFASTFQAGSYHSWTVEPDSLPPCLMSTALDEQGEILAIKHIEKPVWAVQFHPESILSPQGHLLIKNWIRLMDMN